jgi:hypothetical protein
MKFTEQNNQFPIYSRNSYERPHRDLLNVYGTGTFGDSTIRIRGQFLMNLGIFFKIFEINWGFSLVSNELSENLMQSLLKNLDYLEKKSQNVKKTIETKRNKNFKI